MGYSHVGLRLASVVVPEPAQLLLALIGALVLSACRLRA
jgi:hypothetical protein